MKCQGMTLLEVMVALVVFAVGGLALVRTLTAQTNALAELENSTFASWVAENQMVDVRLSTTRPNLSGESGQVSMAGRTYYWHWQGVETSDPLFRALDMAVRDKEKAVDPRITLRSYIAKQ